MSAPVSQPVTVHTASGNRYVSDQRQFALVAAFPVMRPVGLSTIAALAVGVCALSVSAPLIAYAAAPGLAIAYWRNAIAAGVLVPVAAVRRRDELAGLVRTRAGRRTGLLCLLAGLALAVHFGTWVPSAKLTSAASATALVSTTPVWTALIAVVRGIHVPLATWLGIAVSVLGAALAAGADVTLSGRAFVGDLLALVGALAAGFYTTYGERARATISTTTYTMVCYTLCAVLLGVASLAGGVHLSGYPTATWLAIAVMTLGPQFGGHSLVNYALRRVSATTVAVVLLLEVPGAALVAWLLLGQLPASRSLPGLVLVVLGVAVVVLGARRRADRSGQPPQPTNGGIAISPDAIGTT
jgi:drug/metabolite transporter (DMT)-like permease